MKQDFHKRLVQCRLQLYSHLCHNMKTLLMVVKYPLQQRHLFQSKDAWFAEVECTDANRQNFLDEDSITDKGKVSHHHCCHCDMQVVHSSCDIVHRPNKSGHSISLTAKSVGMSEIMIIVSLAKSISLAAIA